MGLSYTVRSNVNKSFYWSAGITLLIGFGLCLVSLFRLCSQSCNQTHLWRFWGLHFETIGLIFFPILIAAHFASWNNRFFGKIASWMLSGAVGAEILFIGVQKFQIGHWCPVCLSIAGTLFVTALIYSAEYLKEDHMKSISKSIGAITLVTIGFLTAFFGTAKEDVAKNAENSIRDRIAFGNPDSNVEVFLFTDWQCPACRGLEPVFVQLAPSIMKKARMTFADIDIHPETLNFLPYNLSFMVHNKDKYLQLRDVLTEISTTTKEPTDDIVNQAIKKYGVKYKPMHYADIAVANKYFKHLESQFDLESTPTLVIVNLSDKRGKKFVGKEITYDNVMSAIDKMSK
jgi:thiol-disulfide isomerase/thioredoxin